MDLNVSVNVGGGASGGEMRTYIVPAGLLTHCSAYFRNMLSAPIAMAEATNGVINLNHITPHAWEQCFKFMQPHSPQENPSVDMNNVSVLLPLFHEFQMDEWIAECERVLTDYLIGVTTGAEKNLSEQCIADFWRHKSEQRTITFNNIVEIYLASSYYQSSLLSSLEEALNNILTWIEYTADLFDTETIKKLVPNIDFTRASYTGVEEGIMNIIGKSIKVAVNGNGNHTDVVFAFMSSLLREASQKKQINKLEQKVDAGKSIITTAYSHYAGDLFYTLPHNGLHNISDGALAQSQTKQILQRIMMKGYKDKEQQHNILGVDPPHVDDETSLEVQIEEAAYHYIKNNDNNGTTTVGARDILNYVAPLLNRVRREERREIFPRAIKKLHINTRIAPVHSAEEEVVVLGYVSVSPVQSYS